MENKKDVVNSLDSLDSLDSLESKPMSFNELRKINVKSLVESKHVRGKKLDYLSWAAAYSIAMCIDKDFSFSFDKVEYFADTAMVFCSTTLFGKTRQMYLPACASTDFVKKSPGESEEDFLAKKNQFKNPDAFKINTAIQRCLAKCIALHGIGIDLYVGEDLDALDSIQLNAPTKPEVNTLDVSLAQKLILSSSSVEKMRDRYKELILTCSSEDDKKILTDMCKKRKEQLDELDKKVDVD